MWKYIVQFFTHLYIRMSCYMCCKSKCNVEMGRASPPPTPPTEVRQTEL